MDLKLIQLNCWAGRLPDQIESLIKKEQPDIICLQEAISLPGDNAFLFITLEEMQKAAGMGYVHFSPVFGIGYMNRHANLGNAILSRHPIVETETVFVHGEYIENLDGCTDSSNMRNFQYGKIELPDGKHLNVINYHGYHIRGHKNGDEVTLGICQRIADYAKGLDGPTIITGDFNLAPNSPSMKVFGKSFYNWVDNFGLSTTRSSFSLKTEPVDYILTSEGIECVYFEAMDQVVSDHLALDLEFSL